MHIIFRRAFLFRLRKILFQKFSISPLVPSERSPGRGTWVFLIVFAWTTDWDDGICSCSKFSAGIQNLAWVWIQISMVLIQDLFFKKWEAWCNAIPKESLRFQNWFCFSIAPINFQHSFFQKCAMAEGSSNKVSRMQSDQDSRAFEWSFASEAFSFPS